MEDLKKEKLCNPLPEIDLSALTGGDQEHYLNKMIASPSFLEPTRSGDNTKFENINYSGNNEITPKPSGVKFYNDIYTK